MDLKLDNRYKIISQEREPYLWIVSISTPNKKEDGLVYLNKNSIFKLLFKREPDIIKLVYKKEAGK